MKVYRIGRKLLFVCVFVVLLLMNTGQAAAAGGVISDGNVEWAYAATFYTQFPRVSFEVPVAPTTQNHMFESGWWFRITGDGSESTFGMPTAENYSGNVATIDWTNVNGRGFNVHLVTTVTDESGGAGSAGMAVHNLTVTNTSGGPLLFNLFHMADFDIQPIDDNDSAVLVAPDCIELSHSSNSNVGQYRAVGAKAYYVAPYEPTSTNARGVLNDGMVSDFNNTGLPFGPDDFTGAFQWDQELLSIGESTSYTVLQTINHAVCPGSLTIVKEAAPADGTDFAFDTNTVSYLYQWGESGLGNGQFNGPHAAAVNEAGNVYVSDAGNDRIEVFDGSGNYLFKWGTTGSGNGAFDIPGDVELDSAGNVYVSDVINDRIQVFDSAGNYLFKWGSSGTGAAQFNVPFGIGIDGDGNVYVAENWSHRISKFDSNGNFLRMWGWGVNTGANAFEICTLASLPCQAGISGGGNGQFFLPWDLEVDEVGNIYVTDTANDRVQVFNSDGTYQFQWGSAGDGAGQFDGPEGIETDNTGNVYVIERFNHRVQVFNVNGNFQHMWGWGVNTGAQEFEICTTASFPCQAGRPGGATRRLSGPRGVTVGPDGKIFIADTANDRVQVLLDEFFVLDDATPDDNDGVIDSVTIPWLPTGSYSFTEAATAGWRLDDISCDSGDWTPDLPNSTLTVNISPGDDVVCTFSSVPDGPDGYQAFIPVILKP